MQRLPEEQLSFLRGYAFALRYAILTADGMDIIPAWTDVVTVYRDGTLHWPIALADASPVYIAVVSGPLHDPRRGQIYRVHRLPYARALGLLE